ncbi:hypothetical protein VSR68_36195 [Paraburkholderia phymatum]
MAVRRVAAALAMSLVEPLPVLSMRGVIRVIVPAVTPPIIELNNLVQ